MSSKKSNKYPCHTYVICLRMDVINEMKESGRRLKSARIALEMTQAALAASAGVSREAIAQAEGGRNFLSTHAMLRIYKRHGISIDWLVGGNTANLSVDIAKKMFGIDNSTAA